MPPRIYAQEELLEYASTPAVAAVSSWWGSQRRI